MINCTPHDIHVQCGNEMMTFKPSKHQLRVDEIDVELDETLQVDDNFIKLRAPKQYTKLGGELPPDGSSIIVSFMLADKCMDELIAHNYKVYAPDTGSGVLRENGRITGTKFLIKYRN